MNGIPSEDEVICPECEEPCDIIYTDGINCKAYGCNKCLKPMDAWEWFDWNKEINKGDDRND